MSASAFYYTDFHLENDGQTVDFNYRLETGDEVFSLCEKIKFPVKLTESLSVQKALRSLHIALGISYYKVLLPANIVHTYAMNEREAEFWNTVFKKGLGEFLLTNGLSTGVLARFEPQEGLEYGNEKGAALVRQAVLGIGGGKDSIVAGELLKEISVPTTGFVLATGSTLGQTKEVADIMGYNLYAIERFLDPTMFELNKRPDAHNGHVPISLIFGLVGCVVAIATGSQHVVVANEASASIPQTVHDGEHVNHQWSKSLEFEKIFQNHIANNIHENLSYSSLIRPLTSVAVAKIFATYDAYFESFTSDNSLFKIKQGEREHPRWSKDSSKSLSSFILLAPWLHDEALIAIFGRNFLDEPLETTFLSLLGLNDAPILDCVGTPDELRLCISMLQKNGRFASSRLMRLAEEANVFIADTEEKLFNTLQLSSEHSLPADLEQDVINKLKEKLA